LSRSANVPLTGNRCRLLGRASLRYAFIEEARSVSSTSPGSKKRSTSSTVSKRNLNAPAAPTLSSRRRVTKPSSLGEEPANESYESVWDAIEDDLGDRQRMKVLSNLMAELRLYIRAKRWTQQVAAKRLGVTQPRISNLMQSRINLFSIDALVEMTGRAGIKLDISVVPKGCSHPRVRRHPGAACEHAEIASTRDPGRQQTNHWAPSLRDGTTPEGWARWPIRSLPGEGEGSWGEG
jgi:predicted XRE-type DNA-binding protein